MRKIYKNPLIILALGILIIGAGSVTATRAAMVAQTAAERVNFKTAALSVDVQELVDSEYISLNEDEDLRFPEITADETVKIGKKYGEDVRVVNDSNNETGYSEYVRVVVKKSWFKDDKKSTDLDPSLIKLEIADGWIENKAEATDEQSVYYMSAPLACGNTAPFITGITIDGKITDIVVNTGTEVEIKNEYVYNGESAYIQIKADAVQTHNAEQAIYAAWGVKATCSAEDDGNILTIDGTSIQ